MIGDVDSSMAEWIDIRLPDMEDEVGRMIWKAQRQEGTNGGRLDGTEKL